MKKMFLVAAIALITSWTVQTHSMLVRKGWISAETAEKLKIGVAEGNPHAGLVGFHVLITALGMSGVYYGESIVAKAFGVLALYLGVGFMVSMLYFRYCKHKHKQWNTGHAAQGEIAPAFA